MHLTLARKSATPVTPNNHHRGPQNQTRSRRVHPVKESVRSDSVEIGVVHGKRSIQSDTDGGQCSKQLKQMDRKKKRQRPGIMVLRDIRRLQNTTHLLMPRAPFARLVREITQKFRRKGVLGGGSGTDFRFQFSALQCIQEAAEFFMVSTFEDVNLAAAHGKRVTSMPRDLSLVMQLRRDPQYQKIMKNTD